MEEQSFSRKAVVKEIEAQKQPWDVLIIGGGATGLGAALESVARGYRTLLLEQHDFAKGTSSRSTKLVHGGVRYLAQGNIPLVMEALRERGRMKRNAPHLVWDQAFVIPCYSWWSLPLYTLGLTFYDLLAGNLGIGRSLPQGRKRTLQQLPSVKKEGLIGGVRYYDCQFDDARMAISLARSVQEKGGTLINYFRVKDLLKEQGKISGVLAEDVETGCQYRVCASTVVNATGVFVDSILKMDRAESPELLRPSQGIHLVLDKRFLNGSAALMIPRTRDGRVLFALPWHGRLVLGTTDVEKPEASLEPVAEEEEVDYILETAERFLDCPPGKKDVLSVFTGLRPLAAPTGRGKKTKEISRGHKIICSESGLVSILGGKWTTYRKMAEDVIRKAASGHLKYSGKSISVHLKIHGYKTDTDHSDPLCCYGTEREKLLSLMEDVPGYEEVISESLSIRHVQVVWAVRKEMARSIEDFLSRRTRALQLDAGESIRMAPEVAGIMAAELGYDKAWEKKEVEAFRALAEQYILGD